MAQNGSKVTRRQFLTYTLTGVGGFMAATLISPMVNFAIDPVLKKSDAGDKVKVISLDDITTEPQRVDFKKQTQDAWYEFEETLSAWVFKNESGEIVALSPICTHLGCQVAYGGDPTRPTEFFCPCHFGRYEKDGTNIPGTPPTSPLARYEKEEKDGFLYLGSPVAQL
ncbi:ubiquinol-cytochrome c reductase iron-sulfur subunit [Exiguobacterium sp. TNDT2]|uniref:QcrA and Rieske domain-containing protein n=1 Tax=Exiguobacterium sp. TNDT2 TaxID=2233531 RepID=UPI000DEEEC0C|nr:ubiquinol-cytochrome c reductase iron-sulfur subunit [Exiguobacterium sp. TNDT2]